MRRFAQRFFLIAGLLGVTLTAGNYAFRFGYESWQNYQFDRQLISKASTLEPRPWSIAELAPVSRDVIGRIAIPRLEISAIVKEGVDDATLGIAVGHVPYTPMPGQQGNVGVAAHRDTLFRNLKDVKRDDVITLTTVANVYEYRVESFQIVAPSEVSVLDGTADEQILTLVTCYPFYYLGNAPMRFIVRARQVPGSHPSTL
jgi:sortase A